MYLPRFFTFSQSFWGSLGPLLGSQGAIFCQVLLSLCRLGDSFVMPEMRSVLCPLFYSVQWALWSYRQLLILWVTQFKVSGDCEVLAQEKKPEQLPCASRAPLTSLSRDASQGLRVQANICSVKLHFLRLLIGSSRIYLQSPRETHASQLSDWKGENGRLALLGLELLSLHPRKYREAPLCRPCIVWGQSLDGSLRG